MPKIPTNDDFDKRLKEVHNDKFKRLEDRIPNQKNIKMLCVTCGEIWMPRIRHLLNGSGCPNCNKTSVGDFDKRVKDIFKDKYIRLGNYDENVGYGKQKIEMKCQICGHIQTQWAKHILSGHGCWKCMRKSLVDGQRLTNEEFISRSKSINGDKKYDYSLLPTLENQRQKVPLICKNHGIFLQSVSDHLYNKSGCPKCKESKGEKYVRVFFETNNIIYIRNKSFNECRYKKPLYFDFFIPSCNTCVEFDGQQHHTGMRVCGKRRFTCDESRKMLSLYKIRDKIKDEYCKNNNIRLLRIGYKDLNNIEEILSGYFLNILTSG